MRGNIEGMRHFPPPRVHAYLDTEEIKRLVKAVKPGLLAAGNLEKIGDRWKLRVTFSSQDGEIIRRAVTIHDADTVEWVRKRIEENRRKWREERERSGALIKLVSDDYIGMEETILNLSGGEYA